MSTKDNRREFDEIAGRLTAEDPSLAQPVRMIPRRLKLAILAVAAILLWGVLSILMVAWGAPGVILTCLTVTLTLGWAIRTHRRT